MKLKPNSNWRAQLKSLFPVLCMIYIPTFCALAGALIQTKATFFELVTDPAELADMPFYFGVLSNLGILIWWGVAAICLFTAEVLRKNAGYVEMTLFFLFSGAFTALLTLDDLFQLHEVVFPRYLHIPDEVTYPVYGILAVLFILKFRAIILATDYLLLFFALGFFAVSLIADMFLPFGPIPPDSPVGGVIEDSAKIFGMVSWFAYFARLALRQIQTALSRS